MYLVSIGIILGIKKNISTNYKTADWPNSLDCTDLKINVEPAVTQYCVASVTYRLGLIHETEVWKTCEKKRHQRNLQTKEPLSRFYVIWKNE